MRWNEGIFGGKVLSEESLKAAFTPVKLDSGEEPMMPYGYGWMIGEYRGLKTISHSGGLKAGPRFSSAISTKTRPSSSSTTPCLGVPGLSPSAIAELVADFFLWQEMKPRPKYEVDESVDPTTFAAYVGRYDFWVR